MSSSNNCAKMVTEIKKEEQICCGKHCDETKGLKSGMGWNRYFVSTKDLIKEQLFCEYCYDIYTKQQCLGCCETYSYKNMKYITGSGFGKENGDYNNFFCKSCVDSISSYDIDEDEYR